MGKKRSSSTSSNSQSQLDPWQAEQWRNLYGQAQEVAANPYQAYAGPTLAGTNADQTGAYDMVRTGVDKNIGADTLQQAKQGMVDAMNYEPQQISGQTYTASQFNGADAGPATMSTAADAGPASLAAAASAGRAASAASRGYAAERMQEASAGPASDAMSRGYDGALADAANINRAGVRDVSGGSVLQQDIGAYMNPYLQNVASNAINDLNRARQIQMTQGANAAQAARAFGGSRHGVADAETNRNFFDILGRTTSDLYSRGFDSALGMAGADLGRGLQANLANQNVDASVANQNAGFMQQANLANQASRNAANQFTSGASNNAALANAAARNNMAQYNAGLSQQARLSNQSAGNAASQFGAAASNQAALANAAAQNNMSQFNAGLNQQANLANASAQNNMSQFNAGLDQQTALANQAAGNNMSQFNAGLDQQAGLANQAATNAANRFGAESQFDANAANQQIGLYGTGLNLNASNQLANLSDQERQQYIQNAALLEQIGNTQQSQQQRVYDDALARYQDQQAEPYRDLQLQASILGGMPTLGQSSSGSSTTTQKGSMLDSIGSALGVAGSLARFVPSDKDIKRNIRPVSEDRILEGVKRTPISAWQYDATKGGPADDRQHIGPMAQSVKKNLGLGDGRTIPIVDAIGTQFAATKALANKVERLEKRSKGKKK